MQTIKLLGGPCHGETKTQVAPTIIRHREQDTGVIYVPAPYVFEWSSGETTHQVQVDRWVPEGVPPSRFVAYVQAEVAVTIFAVLLIRSLLLTHVAVMPDRPSSIESDARRLRSELARPLDDDWFHRYLRITTRTSETTYGNHVIALLTPFDADRNTLAAALRETTLLNVSRRPGRGDRDELLVHVA